MATFQGPPYTVRVPRVVKVGGRELRPGHELSAFADWAASLASSGEPLIIVHGGGEEVSALSERLGLPPQKVDGQRVTTPEVLPLVEGVLAGSVNLRLVGALCSRGVRALGLSGVSASCVVAQDRAEGKLGLVGEPSRTDATFVQGFLLRGFVPVFAPLASDGHGGVLNVNADLFAASLAEALGARLQLITDVPGVVGAEGSVLPTLLPSQVAPLVERGVISGGMVPKVRAALQVLERGAHSVWIGSLSALGTSATEGTWFLPERTSLPSASGWGAAPAPSSLPLLPARVGAGGVS